MTPRGERDLQRLLAVARGDAPADCVLSGARVLSVFTREWLDGDVALVDGIVAGIGDYDGAERIDLRGKYVVPGFIDAHMHFESTRLLPDEYAKQVLPQGTTAVVADPHEIANVLGTEGVRWFVEYCADLPLDVFFMAPSSVPASPHESPRHAIEPRDIAALLELERVLGVAELMNFPGVIAGDERELAKLALGSLHLDGHAPGVVGKELSAYAAAGISSDHEAFTAAEGRERLHAGMWLLIREASPARNLDVLVPLLREFGAAARIAFCTDDREPDDLAGGHINAMVRRAVAAGVPPEDAITAASINAATCHGLRQLGAVAPGYQADLLVLDDLEGFEPSLVLKRGRPVVEPARPAVPAWVRHSVRIQPLDGNSFAVASDGRPIRVIGVIPEQIVTESLVLAPTVAGGRAVADPTRDLVKIAVVERHHATGRIGLGFAQGSGLQRGALASTVAHDAHNIVAVGCSDDDMLAAVARVVELQGGIVAVHEGRVLAECALPVAGLLSTGSAAEVVAESGACSEAAAGLGWTAPAPFMTLSFLPLSVIPALKITDRGLVDVLRGSVVPLARVAGAVRVVDFEPRWRADFARLNTEWLERWFTVEPVDRKVLGDPETHLLGGGGRILLAVDESDAVLGTVALMRHEDGLVELTKMAVEPDLRGAGIGRRLMGAALATFAEMGGRELFLETNTQLEPAIRLYERAGFRRQPAVRPGSHYERANVYMIWERPGSERTGT